MRKIAICAISTVIFFANFVMAQADSSIVNSYSFPNQMPEKKSLDRASFENFVLNSSLFKRLFFDLDAKIQSAGIKIYVCSFKNEITQITTSYKGLWPCLVDHFFESMRVSQNVGQIYFWAYTKKNKLVPVRVDWRPTDKGWGGLFQTVTGLYLENVNDWWRAKGFNKKNNSNSNMILPKSYIGKMTLSFPVGISIMDFYDQIDQRGILLLLKEAQQISLELKPSAIVDNHTQYKGKLIILKGIKNNQAEEMLSLDIITDINIFRLERGFDFDMSGTAILGLDELLPDKALPEGVLP